MANCPKCNYKLSLIDIKPECPVCGVNVVYYGIEDRLEAEADQAEYEHALMQPRFDRLKASFIGSKVAIVRLVICILPLVATLLPLGHVSITLPYYAEETTVNVISIVQYFMDFDLDFILDMFSSDMAGVAFICFAAAIVFTALAVVIALVNIINLMFACAPKGIKRNITTASIGLGFTVLASVAFEIWAYQLSALVPGIFSGTVSWGVIGVMLTFVAEIVINIIYKKMNIQVKYKDVSQYLIAYKDRVKTEEQSDAS